MVAALLCREMKWTWQEYREQPVSFVRTLLEMLQSESAELKRKHNL